MLNKESFLNTFTSFGLSQSPLNSHYHRYVISLSGGMDSVVLLHLFFTLKESSLLEHVELGAIYVNHNLSPNAEMWGDFCQSICSQYQIPLQILRVNAKPLSRQSPEAAARDARYGAIKNNLTHNECLLTAHHKNDQIETLLLNLLRGSGPKGLSAMAVNRQFANFNLVRPLLTFSQQEIKEYALKNHLKWIDDESNRNQKFKRNFLRHTLIPKIQQQWNGYENSLSRVCELQKEAVEILEEVADQDLLSCLDNINAQQTMILSYIHIHFRHSILNLDKLKKLSPARIKNCMQFWFRKSNVNVLNANLLNQFMATFINKAPSSASLISWGLGEQQHHLKYYNNQLFLYSTYAEDNESIHKQVPVVNKIINSELPYQIVYRKGGEKFKKNNLSNHFLLKKWFQEQAIPPWLRDKIPLFYINDELIQIGNTLVNLDYKLIQFDSDVVRGRSQLESKL